MKKLSLNPALNSTKKYLLALSGGPDSMALFFALLNSKINFAVAHVNYHKRKESDIEEKAIKELCNQNDIPCFVLDTKEMKCEGNFQAWARKIRYDFFAELYKKHHFSALLTAHQQDDYIETFLMQQKQNKLVSYYGIQKETTINSMRVIRPLLDYTKQELKDYNDRNRFLYFIDSSNLEDHYYRNRIRHNNVAKLDKESRNNLLCNIQVRNSNLSDLNDKLERLIIENTIDLSSFNHLIEEEQVRLLFRFITLQLPSKYHKLSYLRLYEISKSLLSNKPNVKIKIDGDFYVIKEYQKIRIIEISKVVDYMIRIETPGIYQNQFFYLDTLRNPNSLNIKEDSYPLVVRNARPGDIVRFGKIHKKVNRLFINEKVPAFKRKSFPVLLDKNGIIIYIPLSGKHSSKNMENRQLFVVK